MNRLSHIDEDGNASMVDITEKSESIRVARASGIIKVSKDIFLAIREKSNPKGDVISTARIAGIMAVKRTPELIPLCHALLITGINIDFSFHQEEGYISCECEVKLTGKTGAEMEALTGVSVALLTVYDMCKAIDKTMEISDIRLEEKSGGKSGHYKRKL